MLVLCRYILNCERINSIISGCDWFNIFKVHHRLCCCQPEARSLGRTTFCNQEVWDVEWFLFLAVHRGTFESSYTIVLYKHSSPHSSLWDSFVLLDQLVVFTLFHHSYLNICNDALVVK